MAEATEYLLARLHCDSWYVAGQREHLFVLHFTRYGQKRFAVCFECTTPADKGIYHGSLVSSVSMLPLGDEPDLPAETIGGIHRGLMELAWSAAAGHPAAGPAVSAGAKAA